MAVVLQSATRVNPGSCDHFLLTVAGDGGRTVTVEMALGEVMNNPITDDEIRATLKLWARYHRAKGVSFATLVGKTIFGNIV
jgi:hypothetical protein